MLSSAQRASARAYNATKGPCLPDWPARDSDAYALKAAELQALFGASIDGKFGPRTQAAYKASLLPVSRVKGNPSKRKPGQRDLKKKQFIQLHQMDFKIEHDGVSIPNLKTNLAVCEDDVVVEVHPLDFVVVDNYSDFYHIEVSWVSKSREVVKDSKTGKVYHRTASIWTPGKASALETAMIYGAESFRARGIEVVFITHRQTYGDRAIDPDPEIAGEAHRIAEKHGYHLDYDYVRGSGRSAALWYPAGKGKLSQSPWLL